MPKLIEVTTVVEEYSQASMLEPKSNFYIVNALGMVVWLLCRSKKKAQDYIDQEYGKGKYPVKTLKVTGNRDHITAK